MSFMSDETFNMLREKAMSNKEWKPASSPGDLAVRLENREVFNLNSSKVWYDKTKPCPFRLGNVPLIGCWQDFAKMTQWVEPVPEWTKQLDKVNVWCRVSDVSKEHALSNRSVRLIEKYVAGRDYPYLEKCSDYWKFAIPIENLTEPKE